MACYHPLKGFVIGETDNGKRKMKIVPYGTDHLEQHGAELRICSDPFISAYSDRSFREWVQIPCGQCVGCRLDYSRQWANRCMLELEYHTNAWFVTLTYNDLHVPQVDYVDPDTGEVCKALSLKKLDFQLFMKRLRKKVGADNRLRFFMAGEYGSQFQRPHYHAIIFGLKLDDLKFYKRSELGHTYYKSEFVQSTWRDEFGDIGYAVVAPVTWETCAYTARYVMKKLKGADALFYDEHNMQEPFTLMSRKPGIAHQYFVDHPDLYENEHIVISTDDGGRSFKPPRYYDSLYDLDHPEELAEIKEIRRKVAEDAIKLKLSKTDLSYLELLAVEESNLKNKLKSLKRGVDNGKKANARAKGQEGIS